MKTRFLSVFLIVLLATSTLLVFIPKAHAAPTLIDSYSETNQDAYRALTDLHPSDSAAYSSGGNSFTMLPDVNYKITSAKFYLYKTGSPTGYAHAVLYSHSGTYGTSSTVGVELARSDDFDVSTLTGSFALYELTFSGAEQYEMQASTYYVIEFENPQSGTINTSNWIRFARDSSSPTHSGNEITYYNGAWYPSSSNDAIFYVYGEAVSGGPEPVYVTTTPSDTIAPTESLSATKLFYSSATSTTAISIENGAVKSVYVTSQQTAQATATTLAYKTVITALSSLTAVSETLYATKTILGYVTATITDSASPTATLYAIKYLHSTLTLTTQALSSGILWKLIRSVYSETSTATATIEITKQIFAVTITILDTALAEAIAYCSITLGITTLETTLLDIVIPGIVGYFSFPSAISELSLEEILGIALLALTIAICAFAYVATKKKDSYQE